MTQHWTETDDPVTCKNCLQFDAVQSMVRYAFVWRHVDLNVVRAIVTRSEWEHGYHIINEPSSVTKFQMEVDHTSVRAYPVDGEKAFRRPPEDERDYLFAMARAYHSGRTSQRDFYYWVYK